MEHFTHPGHRLVQLKANTKYLCDGCKTHGSGTRYRCNGCDFDLHEYCGTCPRSLSSFMHPHPLSLVVRKAQATRRNERVCNVCGHQVDGLFYRCKDCEFDVHPLCTQLPQSLRHARHPARPLTLQSSSSSSSGWCAICRRLCCSWRYRCGACGFDIHLECVLVPCDPPTQRSVPPFGQPPPPGPPPKSSIPPFNQPPPPQYGGSGHGMPSRYGPPGPPPYGGCGHKMPFRYSPPRPPPCCGYGHETPFGYSPPGRRPYGGYGHGMPSGPPPYGGYAQGMPSGYSKPRPPSYGYGMPSGYSPPRPPSYGYGMPSGYSPNNNGNHQTPTVGRETICQMFRIVSQLAIGVASNVIFGLMS